MDEIGLAFVCIQYGLAFGFVWSGVVIFKDVPSWASALEKSWARNLLPAPPASLMRATAVFDIVVGIWLFTGIALPIAAAVAALHLLQVLVVTGIMSSSYRDVGLLAMAVALVLYGVG
jgi:uncharacterized membrane protein YphA (DoxX/SURF4 family)